RSHHHRSDSMSAPAPPDPSQAVRFFASEDPLEQDALLRREKRRARKEARASLDGVPLERELRRERAATLPAPAPPPLVDERAGKEKRRHRERTEERGADGKKRRERAGSEENEEERRERRRKRKEEKSLGR